MDGEGGPEDDEEVCCSEVLVRFGVSERFRTLGGSTYRHAIEEALRETFPEEHDLGLDLCRIGDVVSCRAPSACGGRTHQSFLDTFAFGLVTPNDIAELDLRLDSLLGVLSLTREAFSLSKGPCATTPSLVNPRSRAFNRDGRTVCFNDGLVIESSDSL